MHVADIFSLPPSSDHSVLSTYYMLYWTWHSHFKKHLRFKSRYRTASLFFKSWLCLCRYCLLNLNITSPLFLEQLVCHIITTKIPFHLCEKQKQNPCVSQDKPQQTYLKHSLHTFVGMMEVYSKYLILKCLLKYLISTVISITKRLWRLVNLYFLCSVPNTVLKVFFYI